MPYLPSSRRIYESSPLAKYRLGPLPLITVLGALSVAYFVFMIYLYATDARYGVNSRTGFWFALGLFAGAIAFYLGFKLLRRRQGINVERTYHEIPSE
jgi:hypothetical protein